jgi:hypothetical protein
MGPALNKASQLGLILKPDSKNFSFYKFMDTITTAENLIKCCGGTKNKGSRAIINNMKVFREVLN